MNKNITSVEQQSSGLKTMTIHFLPLLDWLEAPPPMVITAGEEYLTMVTAAVKDLPSVGSVTVPEELDPAADEVAQSTLET